VVDVLDQRRAGRRAVRDPQLERRFAPSFAVKYSLLPATVEGSDGDALAVRRV
jgi:hypothetical protein